MGAAPPGKQTVFTGRDWPATRNNHRRPLVTPFKPMLQGLLLSLALAGSVFAQDKVDINTADAATLDRVLLNVGPSKAAAIVAYRKQHGPFRSADELAKVKGIGLSTVDKNADRIVLRNAAAPTRTSARKTATAPRRPIASR